MTRGVKPGEGSNQHSHPAGAPMKDRAFGAAAFRFTGLAVRALFSGLARDSPARGDAAPGLRSLYSFAAISLAALSMNAATGPGCET